MSFQAKLDKFKETDDFDWTNLDSLLSGLSTEELEELNGDFDPDNTLLPPSQRCRDQTSKLPTGPLNRKKLLQFLERKAREEKDWEEKKPYTKEKRGKVYVPKEPEKTIINEDNVKVETEWDDILKEATEEELVDLAAVLGFHGMLNQVQFYASLEDRKVEAGGFKGMAQSEELKIVPDQPPNRTDVADSLKRLRENDSKLKHLNLNNIKNIPAETLMEIFETLKMNTNLEVLEMASVDATDRTARVLGECLKENNTLKILNIESNFISGEGILEIFRGINVKQHITEFRVDNQKPSVLGNQVEMELTRLVEQNTTLKRFGIIFEYPDARNRVLEQIQLNNDQMRKERIGKNADAITNANQS